MIRYKKGEADQWCFLPRVYYFLYQHTTECIIALILHHGHQPQAKRATGCLQSVCDVIYLYITDTKRTFKQFSFIYFSNMLPVCKNTEKHKEAQDIQHQNIQLNPQLQRLHQNTKVQQGKFESIHKS